MTIVAAILTISAGLWRFCDGRGYGRTWVRNVAGLAIALACAVMSKFPQFFDISAAVMSGCAILAWLTLILGYTRWESWSSMARYGCPTCAIAVLGYVGGLPALACALYAIGGVLVGWLYVILHRFLPFRYSTAVCEVAAGAAIVGGLGWL